jgi:cellulose synthase/poly-beta-1,6-N-acetylglucosamine synthase-like glycosyltransferase
VAAYLPNEHLHLVQTLEHLIAMPYSGQLQVICAYNTPTPLPIEDELARMARRNPRLAVLPVTGSTSKAENVNAALALANGSVIGIFDADHLPQPGFERATRWLAAGHDVVQGACRVRDGRRSILARVVAAEFDGMYGVTHPGRARVHGFAVFGGSNGYWRSDVLRAARLDPHMLTEDIDASVRSIAAGARLVADPAILSTELAPPTVAALWNERVRWAQGWTQVARRRLRTALASPHLSRRARLGLAW